MSAARQFWLFVVPLLVGFSAAGLLLFAFFFPEQLFAIESVEFVLTVVVAVVSLGVLVWQSAVSNTRFSGGIDGADRDS